MGKLFDNAIDWIESDLARVERDVNEITEYQRPIHQKIVNDDIALLKKSIQQLKEAHEEELERVSRKARLSGYERAMEVQKQIEEGSYDF